MKVLVELVSSRGIYINICIYMEGAFSYTDTDDRDTLTVRVSTMA